MSLAAALCSVVKRVLLWGGGLTSCMRVQLLLCGEGARLS
jgi:hypothetical protein